MRGADTHRTTCTPSAEVIVDPTNTTVVDPSALVTVTVVPCVGNSPVMRMPQLPSESFVNRAVAVAVAVAMVMVSTPKSASGSTVDPCGSIYLY